MITRILGESTAARFDDELEACGCGCGCGGQSSDFRAGLKDGVTDEILILP